MSLPDSLRMFLHGSANRSQVPTSTSDASHRSHNRSRLTSGSSFSHDDLPSLDQRTLKTLQKLIHRFLPTNADQSRYSQQQDQAHIQQLVDKYAHILANQNIPSVVEDENNVANLIRRKLLRDSKQSSKSLRFGHLYNKLASQQVLQNKWSILYLLLSLSDSPSADLTFACPSETSPFLPAGLQSLSSSEVSRPPKVQQVSPRNIRRRLASESDDPFHYPAQSVSDDRSLPAAAQLARARYQRAVDPDTSAIHIPETTLLRDLIFIFQGIDGRYIRYDPLIKEYSMDSRISVSQSTKDLVYRLTELGWLYRQVHSFVKLRFNDPEVGLVGQSFASTLQHELTEYYKLIAILEAQIEKQTSAGGDEITLLTEQSLSLKRLLLWTQESLQKLQLMSVLVDACQGQKGGALVSIMHNYTNHGDPFYHEYISNMLQEVSRPFYEMLQRWIYEGELDDPYEEFFVACDPTVSEEELWQNKYSIRENMLPTFISKELAQKIFSIGKSLNFIRYSCHDDTLVEKYYAPTSSHTSIHTFQYGDIQAVEQAIDVTYLDTSKQLLALLKTKYKLMDHLRALKRYLLLGQGDFIQHLMDTLGPGLNRPANTLFRHNLTGVLETAIRASNAQYDDPEILNRLDVRLLEISPDDIGWDVFTLDYHVDSPINTVFSPQAMNQYLRMFNFLWRLKRVEYTLSASWRCWGTASRSFAGIPELAQDLHQAQLMIGRMVHFIYQLQHYYLFEVLECSWEKLETYINDKSIDLDSIIAAHSLYLAEITQKGLLDGAKNQALSMRLHRLFDLILKYKSELDLLHVFASSELARRESGGYPALPAADMGNLEKIRTRQRDVESKFKTHILEFLEILASYHDEDLRSLSTRLDYNDYYSSSDSRRLAKF